MPYKWSSLWVQLLMPHSVSIAFFFFKARLANKNETENLIDFGRSGFIDLFQLSVDIPDIM